MLAFGGLIISLSKLTHYYTNYKKLFVTDLPESENPNL